MNYKLRVRACQKWSSWTTTFRKTFLASIIVAGTALWAVAMVSIIAR